MDRSSQLGTNTPRPLPDPPPWRARWTEWPGSHEPLLLLASPGRPYGGRGFTLDHADSWYCANLGMVAWTRALAIPPLTSLHAHVDGRVLRLCAAGKPWLALSTEDCGVDDCWSAAHLGRTIVGATFTASRPARPPGFDEFFHALHRGTALIADIPVIALTEKRRAR